jgi:DNA polymerase-3 subunit epsilon
MKKIVKMFFDTETTGVKANQNAIHQLAGCIEVDDEIVEYFSFNIKPYPNAKIDPKALSIGGVTLEQIMAYPESSVVLKQFKKLLDKYVSKYDKKDKMTPVGYNNRYFDDNFLRMLFVINGDEFIGSYFWSNSIDVLCLASEYLTDRRAEMPSFKLQRVAQELGIPVDKERLHESKYDVELTRDIYRIVTGRDVEI